MARQFSGSGQYLENTSFPKATWGSAFSAACWVVGGLDNGTVSSLISSRSAGFSGWVLNWEAYNNTGKVGFTHTDGGGNHASNINSPAGPVMIGFTYNQFLAEIQIYVGETAATVIALSGALNPAGWLDGIAIGTNARSSGHTDDYKGGIAEVAVWNVFLTVSEWLALARGARPDTICPLSLVGYWPLRGDDSPEPDMKPNGGTRYPLTLTGATKGNHAPVLPRMPWKGTSPYLSLAEALSLQAHTIGLGDGAAIPTWEDGSVSNNDASQATAGKRPVYKIAIVNGMPVVRFAGGQGFDLASSMVHTDCTIFAVMTNSGSNRMIALGGSSNTFFGISGGTDFLVRGDDDVGTPDGIVSNASGWHVWTAVITGGSVRLYRDGTLASGPYTINARTYSTIGWRASESQSSGGDVAEVRYWNGALSPTARAAIEAELGDKYGIRPPGTTSVFRDKKAFPGMPKAILVQ